MPLLPGPLGLRGRVLGGPGYEEGLVEALLLPAKNLDGSLFGPTLVAEMSILISEYGTPVFRAQIIDLTNHALMYRSNLHSSVTLADLEWVYCVGKSIPGARYDEALKEVT